MDEKRIQNLAVKWLDGTITEQEKQEFARWYNNHNDTAFHSAAEDETLLKQKMFIRILADTQRITTPAQSRRSSNWRWQLGVAASLMLIFSLIYYKTYNTKEVVITRESKAPTLTFADGRTIQLNADQKGIVVDSEIRYLDGRSLASNSKDTAELLRLTTPKGLMYVVTLPDGSKVTMNAGSTLTYPAAFAAHARIVQLEGEAFFEITKVSCKDGVRATGKRVPFLVKTSGQDIEVLGTKFNVSAYKAEQITQTTLLEGSVSVSARLQSTAGSLQTVILTPGQQAQTTSKAISVVAVDAESFTAWKEGYFYFENASVPTVMLQLKRWYDFEFSYQSGIPDNVFSGKIPRDITLYNALKILNKAGIKATLTAENNVFIAAPEQSHK